MGEVEELRAEFERLRAERDAAQEHVAYHLRDYALNTDLTGDLAVDMAAYAGRMKIRAEAAEARVARVEALRDRWLEDAENDNIRLEDVARDLTGALAGKRRATPKTPCPECRCLYGTHQKACPGYAQPARADEFEADQ